MSVPITAGSGTLIAADSVSGVNYQYVKLDVGTAGNALPVTAGGANYLPVQLMALGTGLNLPVSPASGAQFAVVNASATTLAISASAAIPVSAVVTAPVFVQLSNGTTAITTLPVSGTVTANQGTAAANSSAWPILITDGTHQASLTNFSGNYAVNVNVLGTVNGGGVQVDNSSFTVGTSSVFVNGALYNDSATQPTAGQAAAIRMTQNRAMHINLRTAAGTEIGTSGSPVYVQPTGSGTQPISGTVSANITQFGGSNIVAAAAGIPKVGLTDNTGTAYSDSNPLLVQQAAKFRTRVTKDVALTASQTGTTLWTPTSGKAFYITSVLLKITVTGTLTIFDATNSAANILSDGTEPVESVQWTFDPPWASAAVNNVLKYTSGTGLTGNIVLHGFEE